MTTVVDGVLDAPAPAPGRPPRDVALAFSGWLVGSAGFVLSLLFNLELSLSGAAQGIFLVLLSACGVLATLGIAWFTSWAHSAALRVLGAILLVITALPAGLAALVTLLFLLSRLT